MAASTTSPTNGSVTDPSSAAGTPLKSAKSGRTQELSRADLTKLAETQRRKRAEALGSIVALLSRAEGYRDMTLKDLEWLVMPALATGQYMIAETKPSETKRGGVAAVLLYASVSPEVEAKIKAAGNVPPRLTAADWISGPLKTVVVAVGTGAGLSGLRARFGSL
jgi:hemolysin-activating ACP:hemolysin acyltransferase